MRIISGKAGGITLSVPKGEVRPTTDRVREAVFSILNPLMDRADVLDLFTGSGAFGLEALSRGAGNARMVDFSRTGGYPPDSGRQFPRRLPFRYPSPPALPQ